MPILHTIPRVGVINLVVLHESLPELHGNTQDG
jgi:hypothetical protein